MKPVDAAIEYVQRQVSVDPDPDLDRYNSLAMYFVTGYLAPSDTVTRRELSRLLRAVSDTVHERLNRKENDANRAQSR